MNLSQDQRGAVLTPLNDALTYEDRDEREDLFAAYMGEQYAEDSNLKDTQSKFISPDVSDVVEAVFAEGMELFASDDNLAEFAPVGMEDEAAAEQETLVIHHLLREKNNFFPLMSTWFKEGLIEQNAYIRAGWVEKERVKIEEYEGLTLDEFMQVYANVSQSGDDYEVEEAEGVQFKEDGMPIPMMDAQGQPAPINVRIRCVKKEKEYEIEPIPQNDFFISPRWTKPTLHGVKACGVKTKKSKAALRSMGFSEDSIEKLDPDYEDGADQNRHNTRYNDDTSTDYAEDLEIAEAYVMAEVDKDGSERLLKVWTDGQGKHILKWGNGKDAVEEVEFRPFAPWTPYIVPHRHVGRSVAELASVLAKLKSTLWRHTLDSVYKTMYPRPLVTEQLASENTYKDLMLPNHGAPIRQNEPGAVEWTKAPSVLGETLPLMDRADETLEKSAGVTRYAQGLQSDALSKSAVGSEGIQSIMDAGMRRIQVIIRTFAEVGLRELFLIMHRDFRRGPSRELAMKIRGEWIQANPLQWRERTDMSVRIGTGKADREKRIAGLSFVLSRLEAKMATGDPSATQQGVYEVEKRIAREMGVQSLEPFITDPSTLQPPPPQDPEADPAMVMARAEETKGQADLLTAQTKQQQAGEELRLKGEHLQLEREIAQFKAQEAEALLEIKREETRIKAAELEIKDAEAAAKIESTLTQ